MLAEVIGEALREAKGSRRHDPVTAGTGGPAGNAVLTAWTGLALLVLFVAELVTLLDLSGLISWHVVLGIVLVPVALLKTATTGLRIIRYYLGDRLYRSAGPPPLLLRLLGPLVVMFTLALLGSGVLMIVLGPQTSREGIVTVVGHPVSLVSLHAGLAVCWAVVTGLHVLGRLASALLIVGVTRLPWAVPGRREGHVPGTAARALVLVATALLAGVAITLVVPVNAGWTRGDHHREDARHARTTP